MVTLSASEHNKRIVINAIMKNMISINDIAQKFGNSKAILPRAIITEFYKKGYVEKIIDIEHQQIYIIVTDKGKEYFNNFLNKKDIKK